MIYFFNMDTKLYSIDLGLNFFPEGANNYAVDICNHIRPTMS